MEIERSVTMLADLAAEPWAMEPHRLQALFARFTQLGPQIAAVAKIEIDRPEPKLAVIDGTAVIGIQGVLLKSVPKWMAFFGIAATAYGDVARLVTQAAADPNVQQIRLEIDSPGGTVAGVLDAARAIRTARARKPVTAQVQDLAASAAYWLASQAGSIAADLNAEVGSIGVYTVYYDASRMAEQDGVKVHVIASGEHKGMGVFGAPITDGQIAAMREVIDGIAENFVSAVADGRGLELAAAQALATGRLWEAKAALAHQLIDSLSGSPAAGTSASGKPKSESEGDITMSENKDQTATLDAAQLKAEGQQAGAEAERTKLAAFKAAFPHDLEFAVASFENGATLAQAQAQYALIEKRTKAAAAVATGADGRIGTQAAEGNAAAADGPDFLAASRAYAAQHHCSMTEAMKTVRRTQPQLHRRFLERAEAEARPVKGTAERIQS